MPCVWEGNRRSGVALAMPHRLNWFIQLQAHGLDREMSTPPTLSCGAWPNYLFTLPHKKIIESFFLCDTNDANILNLTLCKSQENL